MDDSDKKADSGKDQRAGIDFITSIFLMLICIPVSFWSYQMKGPGAWVSAPGLIPLFLSVSTFFMGLGLFVSSIRNQGPSQLKTKCRIAPLKESMGSVKVKRSLWIILLMGFYVFILVGRIPFELATFIYLASTLYVFWRRGGWLKIILVSVLFPCVFSTVFRVFFSIRLPGDAHFEFLYAYILKFLK